MNYDALRWSGADAPYLDTPHVQRCGPLVLGCYGGTTQVGADKNEDAALIWSAPDRAWECAFIVDAHHSAESAALLLDIFSAEEKTCIELLQGSRHTALKQLHDHLIGVLSSKDVRQKCRSIQGEASCLFLARHSEYLMWFSIGDCMAFLFHPVLTQFGQYALNQRVFYQWLGHVNTFDRDIPCYSTGTQLLQPGRNIILLITDGLIECGDGLLNDPRALYTLFSTPEALEQRAHMALQLVKTEAGHDSATLIAWEFDPVSLFTLP